MVAKKVRKQRNGFLTFLRLKETMRQGIQKKGATDDGDRRESCSKNERGDEI